jgi:hypothetical protein
MGGSLGQDPLSQDDNAFETAATLLETIHEAFAQSQP